MKGAKMLGKIVKVSAKKRAHDMTAELVRQFLERGELDEAEGADGPEIEALKEIQRYHERMGDR
jgi:hypothetical protein